MNYRLLIETCWPTCDRFQRESYFVRTLHWHIQYKTPPISAILVKNFDATTICEYIFNTKAVVLLSVTYPYMQIKEEPVILCSGVVHVHGEHIREEHTGFCFCLLSSHDPTRLMSRTHVCLQVFAQWLESANLLIDLFTSVNIGLI